MERVKGFTVVELLIVIAIIGLLAGAMTVSFTGVQRGSRDDRRIADLRQVEEALQVFYLKCGYYPGRYDASGKQCEGGLVGQSGNPATWAALTANLVEAGAGTIPNDPTPSKAYSYFVQLGQAGNGTVPKAQCYVLRATLETDHAALASKADLDGTITLPNLFPAPSVDCSDATHAYCVGNAECFFGG